MLLFAIAIKIGFLHGIVLNEIILRAMLGLLKFLEVRTSVAEIPFLQISEAEVKVNATVVTFEDLCEAQAPSLIDRHPTDVICTDEALLESCREPSSLVFSPKDEAAPCVFIGRENSWDRGVQLASFVFDFHDRFRIAEAEASWLAARRFLNSLATHSVISSLTPEE